MDLEVMDASSLDDSDFVKTEDLGQALNQYDLEDMMSYVVAPDCKEIEACSSTSSHDCKETEFNLSSHETEVNSSSHETEVNSSSSHDATIDVKSPDIKSPMCSVCKVVPYQFHHFGAYVCNRCRAFFRRTVRRIRRGGIVADCIITKQPYSGFTKPMCDITLFRGACQACRFATCIEQGMDPETVLTDQARNLKYAKSAEKEPKIKKKAAKPSTRASKASQAAPESAAASSFAAESHMPLPPNSFYYDRPIERPPWLEESWPFTAVSVASTQFIVPSDIAPRKP